MNLSINVEHFNKIRCSNDLRTPEQCIDIAYDAGFRYIDLAARELPDEKV